MPNNYRPFIMSVWDAKRKQNSINEQDTTTPLNPCHTLRKMHQKSKVLMNKMPHAPSDPVSQTVRGWTERWAGLWCWCRWRLYTDERRWQRRPLSDSCCHCGGLRWPSSPHQWTISGTQEMELRILSVIHWHWTPAPNQTDTEWAESFFHTIQPTAHDDARS